jgi:glyoxylase-like metal-dependent hydrolase (beta-lactamase superfamily II)
MDGQIKGFTSAKIFDLKIADETIKILFSGDTIIHPDFWGTLELPKIWGRFMLETLEEIGPQPLYWFLISSGFRTYRFLPAYFHEFYPRHDKATPTKMQEILDSAATRLFGNRYNPAEGIIRLEHPTPLRKGLSASGEERKGNPHIDFFLKSNPGCVEGDELACITQLTLENIKPFVKRLLRS